MALPFSTPLFRIKSPTIPSHHFQLSSLSSFPLFPKRTLIFNPNPRRPSKKKMVMLNAANAQTVVLDALKLIQTSPPTWKSAIFSNIFIFVAGSRILVSGLSLSGIVAAFLLGTLTWRAFGPPGFLLVATYFVIVS